MQTERRYIERALQKHKGRLLFSALPVGSSASICSVTQRHNRTCKKGAFIDAEGDFNNLIGTTNRVFRDLRVAIVGLSGRLVEELRLPQYNVATIIISFTVLP